MKPILYSPVQVLKGSPFAFTVELENLLSTYDNFLVIVYQNDGQDETVLSKLTKEVKTGYEIGITVVDTTTVLVTVPADDTTSAEEAFYNVEFACMDSDSKEVNFIIPKLFEIKETKI